MTDINITKLPKCPKCKSDMVPLSEPREKMYCKDYCLTFAKWKCVKCEHEIKHNE